MGTRSLITAPTAEPVSLEEAKAHLRVTDAVEDGLIAALIASARGHVEARTGRQLMEATHELVLDAFPVGPCELLPAPLLSVVSVTYLDAEGDPTVVSSADYRVEAYVGPTCRPGLLSLAYLESWPTPQSIERNVRIRYKAGYLTTTATSEEQQRAAVPAELRQAILLLVGEMYARRTVATTGTSVVPNLFAVDALCGPFTIYRWAA